MTKLLSAVGNFGKGFITPAARLGHTVKGVGGDAIKAVGQVTRSPGIQSAGQKIMDTARAGQEATKLTAMKGKGIPFQIGRVAGAGTLGTSILSAPLTAGQIMKMREMGNDPASRNDLMTNVQQGAENRIKEHVKNIGVGSILNPRAYADSLINNNENMYHAAGIAGRGSRTGEAGKEDQMSGYVPESKPSAMDWAKTFMPAGVSPKLEAQAFRAYAPVTPIKSGAFILAPSLIKEGGDPGKLIKGIKGIWSTGSNLIKGLGRPVIAGPAMTGAAYLAGRGKGEYALRQQAFNHGEGLADQAVYDTTSKGVIPTAALNAQTNNQLNETLKPYLESFRKKTTIPLRPSDPLQPKPNGVMPNDPINDPLISGYNYGYGNQ
jgi:hypothetical protein